MGKPGKLKSGSHSKLNRWSKGNSSASNPSTFKFREKARSSFYHQKKSNEGLTKGNLQVHDQLKGDSTTAVNKMIVASEVDGQSDSAETVGTFLSGLSDCTNLTFRKIQRFWQSNSAEHKEVCAVLAAVTDVLREHNSDESDTAYFAALMTALSNVDKIQSAAALSYLLSLAIKKVPVAVLQAKFGEVSKLLCDMLGQITLKKGTAPVAFVRSIFSCLATLLRHQDLSVWENSSTVKVFRSILLQINHSKPKIRKSSQDAVHSILIGSDFMKDIELTDFIHPAALVTADALILQLEKYGGTSSTVDLCHILQFLGRVLPCFSRGSVKKVCENVLKVMLLSDPLVKSVCMKCLEGVFNVKAPTTVVTPELNAKIITALYDYYPNKLDVDGTLSWLSIMTKSILFLFNQYNNLPSKSQAIHLGLVHVPKLLITCFKLLLSPSDVIQKASALTAKSLFSDGVGKVWNSNEVADADRAKFAASVSKTLEDGLKYKYNVVWNMVFEIYEVSFKSFLSSSHLHLVKSFLENIVNLRNTPHFRFKDELDLAVGSAIAALGPRLFLEAVPLEIEGTDPDKDLLRSWLITLLKRHIKNAELSFYSQYFLPLATNLQSTADSMRQKNNLIPAASYQTLYIQCWDLLPVFCKEAIDIAASFPKVARVMGRAIEETKDLQLPVMLAMRNLITACKKSERDQAVVSGYCKNFLPILFNLYTDKASEDEEKTTAANKVKSIERLGSLETIRVLLTIASEDLISAYFMKVQTKLFDSTELSVSSQLALLDLLIAMIGYVSIEQIENIYSPVKELLSSYDYSMQKKAYRVFQEISSSRFQPCLTFVNSHLLEFKNLLLDGLSSASMPSKGPRISCMEQVYLLLVAQPEMKKECDEFLNAMLPEVMLCTNEAKRSRVAAFNLLVNAAKAYATDESDIICPTRLEEYLDIVCIGFGGTPTMMKATIITLSRLIFEFKDQISSTLLQKTIDNICILLGSNTREISKASFGFVFVLLHILEKDQFAQHIKSILDALLNWNDATRRYLRLSVKKFLLKILKKYGYDTIHSMVPEKHKKQLVHVRKYLARSKKLASEKKSKVSDLDEEKKVLDGKKETMDEILQFSDESEDEKEEPMKRKKKSKSKSSTWLQELQDSSDPIDLLDPAASQKVLTSDPKSQKASKREAFKTAPDGRLIINDEKDDDDDDVEKKMLKSIGMASKIETLDNAKAKKRKRIDSDDEDINEDASNSCPSRKKMYKPGGKGIHRTQKHDETGSKFKSKKAGGDISRKGSQQPYAYLPFNSQVLNKRKQKKLTGQYVGIMKSVKKGAVDGEKKRKAKRKK